MKLIFSYTYATDIPQKYLRLDFLHKQIGKSSYFDTSSPFKLSLAQCFVEQ